MEKSKILAYLREESARFSGLSVFLETAGERRTAAEKAEAFQIACQIIEALAYELPAENKLPPLPTGGD